MPPTDVVFLSTAWGPRWGGINAFNRDLAVALAELLRPLTTLRVACVVPSGVVEARKVDGVEVLSLGREDSERGELQIEDAQVITELLARHKFAGSILVGHDLHTGPVALAVRDLLNAKVDGASQVAVIVHTRPAAYKWLEGGDPEQIHRKVERQREIVRSAEMVFGVGHRLCRTARDLLRQRIHDRQPPREPVMLLPGLADIEPYAKSPEQFQAITFGRLDPRADRVKQGRLALAGFAGVIAARYGDLGDDPHFNLVGADEDDVADIHRLAAEQAGRPIAVYARPFSEDRAQLWNLLSNQSVSLMLSVHEGFGLTGWEAIAAGVPLIVSQNTGLYELLKDHKNLGGKALGCVSVVDVRSSLDEGSFDERDLVAVGEHLARIARSPSESKRDALNLRELCQDAGLTWEATAVAFMEGCGLKLPELAPRAVFNDGAFVPEGWARVSFDDPRGLEAALSGESLGPRDVVACPRLAEVEELRIALDQRNYAGLVGPSGSGKSLAIFHVARDAEATGTTIYRLTDSLAGVASLDSIKAKSALLLVDDAHLFPRHTISALRDAATDDKKFLFAGIDSIPGLVRPVVVDVNRLVARLADEMMQRIDEVRQAVQRIDRHVGEGYMDTSIERILEDAAKSKTPWQYMFVLGRGHLRCRDAIVNLERADRADLVLLVVSMGQIARHDNAVDRDELYAFARAHGRDEAWVDQCLRVIQDQGLLFIERGRVTTPHPRLALKVIALAIKGAWSVPAFWEYLRELLVDEGLPLSGRAWLIRELHFGDTISVGWRAVTPEIRDVIHGQLTLHDGTDEGMAASAWMLDALIRYENDYSLKLVKAAAAWLVGLVHEAGRASGYALYNVVNDIHNADQDWGREFAASVDAGIMADKLVKADVDEFGALEALVDRLIVCAGEDWENSFFAHLDHDRLTERWALWPLERVYQMASFSKFLVWRGTKEARQLLRSMYPAIRRAFHSNVLDAWNQLSELVTIILGFGPLFDERPSDHRLDIARELGELIDARDVGIALSTSRQRDWEPLAVLVDWLHIAAPDTWKEVAAFVNVEPLLEQARALVKAMPRDLHMLFIMLILCEDGQPFLSVIVELQDDINLLPVRFAALAPSVGVHILNRGGRLQWGLSGGLPRWEQAVKILTYLEKQDAGLAARFLESAVDEIADGLKLTQDNSGRHVGEFLSTAERIAPEILDRACARLDPDAASKHWSGRVAGSQEAKTAVLEVLRFVNGRPGPAQSIAAELMRSA